MSWPLARRLTSAPFLAAALLGDPGCHDDATPAAPAASAVATPTVTERAEPAAEPTTLTLPTGAAVTYELAWDWQNTTPSGHHHTLTTALGYHVSIEALYTATLSMELLPCTVARHAAPSRSPLGWLAPRRASADHSYAPDASVLTLAFPENTADAGPRTFGTARASGQPYCQLFALSGPVADWASDGFRMQGWSLYFRGSYARGDEPAQSVEAFVGLGRGSLRPLTAVEALPSPASQARVTLTRHIAQALDPIDFASLAPTDLAFEILEHLGTTATVTVQ